jgi:glycosyltransferase involved in cell wall biosynthesis
MRVLFVNPAGILGGAERSLLDLIVSLRASRPSLDPRLLLLADGPLVRQVEEIGVPVRVLSMPAALGDLGDSVLGARGGAPAALDLLSSVAGAGLRLPGFVRRLRALVREERPDLIHSNGNKSHLLASLAAVKGIPIVWHVRDFIGSRRVMARLLGAARGRAASAIAISKAVGEDVEATLPGLPVDVVYNAIDVESFAPGPGDGRHLDALAGAPALRDGGVRVGLVATFAHWKGHGVFIEAAARALGSLPAESVRFYVVGGPVYATRGSQVSQESLKARAERLGIAGEVAFAGFQGEIAGVYRALDIVVHASTQPEPFGRTIVEAMACGRPVIASRAGGAAEIFDHGRDAIGVPPGDAEALAAAIISLAARPEERRRLGEEARRTAVARFSRTRLGPEVGGIYDALLSRKPAPIL